MSAFLKNNFERNFKVQKSVFMKHPIVVLQCYSMTKANYFVIM